MKKFSSLKKSTKKIAGKLFKALFQIELKGLENYPNHIKRLVIVANHTSLIDGILLWIFLPNQPTFAVNIFTAQKWWASWITFFTRIFLVDSTKPMAMKSLVEYVSNDQHCVIFPEGRMTITGGLMKIYEGPGLVADHANAPILPIHIEGAQFSIFSRLKGKLKLQLFPKIKLTIFPPRYLTIPSNLKGRERRKILTEKLYEIMCEIDFLSQNRNITLFQSLIEAQKQHGKRKIIIEDFMHNTLTYKQLITRSLILAQSIPSLTTNSEIVGVLLPNVITYLIVFFSLQVQFRIPALLNYTMNQNQLIQCCKVAHIKTIFTAKKFIETANLTNLILALKNENIRIIFIEDLKQQVTLADYLIGTFWSFFPKIYDKKLQKINDINAAEITNNPALILFTSGSENIPKGVALSHQNLQSNRFQITSKLNFTHQDLVFNALPLFHAFSLNVGLLSPIFSGIKIFIYPTPLHFRKIPELCYTTNATILFSANTFLAKYAKFANSFDFQSLKYVFAGAEKLQEETRKIWLDKFGIRILEGYGATEASPILTANTAMQNQTGTVGKFLPHIEYQLKPIEGISEGGELWVKGPNIMLGYLNPEQPMTFISPKDGWYRTGDIVYINKEGFISIRDRVKRFAKIGGEMISLSTIESAITQLWPNFQHAVISLLDERKGEKLILITTYPEATRQEIIQNAKHIGLTNLAIPKEIKILNKIPALATGKTDYPSLLALISAKSCNPI